MWTFHITRTSRVTIKAPMTSYTDAVLHLSDSAVKNLIDRELAGNATECVVNQFGDALPAGRGTDPGLMEALPVYYIANRLRLVGAVDPMEDYAVQWGTAIREYYEFLRTEPESTGLDAVEAYLQKKYPDLGTLPSGYNVNTSNTQP